MRRELSVVAQLPWPAFATSSRPFSESMAASPNASAAPPCCPSFEAVCRDDVAPRTLLLGDNASSIKSETNGSDNDGSKHVDVMAHYVRERMRAGDLHYTYVTTNENIADCMTKNNFYPAFKKFRAAMGVA